MSRRRGTCREEREDGDDEKGPRGGVLQQCLGGEDLSLFKG